MREGWEKLKIKDICIKGSSNIAQNKIEGLSGDYAVYGASGYVQNVDFYHQNKPYIGIVKDGSGVGRVNVYPAYSSLLGTLQYIIPKEGYLLNYVAYALNSKNLSSFAAGAAIPHIYFKDYGECEVLVPSQETQQQIVAELDLLSHILDQKRQQLKEYEALAESIFYDMFGDPMENPKRWEVKTFGLLCKVFAGGDKPCDISCESTEEYKYPVIANGDGDKGILGYSKNYRIKEDSVTIGSRGASIGNCRIVRQPFTPVVRLIALVPSANIEIAYLYFAAIRTKFKISGAGQAQLTVPNVKDERLLLPPLSLQQSFASKIDAIEKQKKMLTESIKETETLFQSRMDYWFNDIE